MKSEFRLMAEVIEKKIIIYYLKEHDYES